MGGRREGERESKEEGRRERGGRERVKKRGGRGEGKRGEGEGREEEGSCVIFFRVCFHWHLFQVALKLLVSHWEGVEEVVQRHSRPNLFSRHNELILSYTGNILRIY